jgi:very-short-patch-repair endonuclease
MDAIDIDNAIAALADPQHGAFARLQAEGVGATNRQMRRRVAGGRWKDLGEDVLVVAGAHRTWRLRVSIAVLAGTGGIASHRTAAALWGLPGFAENHIEISRQIDGKSTSRHARVHRSRWLPAEHVRTIDGISVTTVARTLFDLAAVVSFDRLDNAVENALKMRLTSVERLEAMLLEMALRGRPGVRQMRRALVKRGPGYIPNESELEREWEALLEHAGEPLPRRQVEVGGEHWIGRVDYRDDKSPVIWEIDGRTHHQQLLDSTRDARRRADLTAAGLIPVTFTTEQIRRDPEWVLDVVRKTRRRYSVDREPPKPRLRKPTEREPEGL